MPRAIRSLNNYAPYLNDTPSRKPKPDIRDRMLTGLVALSTAVIIVGFVFAVANFFGYPALVGGLVTNDLLGKFRRNIDADGSPKPRGGDHRYRRRGLVREAQPGRLRMPIQVGRRDGLSSI